VIRILPLILLLLVACQPLDSSPSDSTDANTALTPLPTLAPDLVQLGETVYADNCASRHGANLEGEANWKEQNADGTFRAPPHDETGHTWHHGDPTLLAAIRLGGARLEDMNIGGSSEMPSFADTLSDEEITAVLSYIKSTWSAEIRQLQAEATRREEQQ
jgi:mono/diheme cytochrome c family protein